MRKNMMIGFRTIARCWALALAALSCLAATSIHAAPLRFATISWTEESNNFVRFDVQTAWGSTGSPLPAVGSSVGLGLNFSFGDATSQSLSGTVNSVVGDWFVTNSSFTHAYASGDSFTAGFAGCCTLPNLQNTNANNDYDITTQVNLTSGSSARSPRSTVVPLLFMQLGTNVISFFLPASTYNGETARFVLDPLGGNAQQPDFLSLQSFGLLSVDTSAESLHSGLYDLRYRIESVNSNMQVSSSTSVYMLLDLVCATGPSCSNPGPQQPTDVPEPGSLALLGIALAGLAATRRRKN